jgi:hypothetical protein
VPDVCVCFRELLEWRGSKRGCESLSIDGQRSTMHASPNASFCRGTRQAPQHAVLSTRRACNCSRCPCGSLGARCHLLGPELRHAAVASLMCGCCISTRPLLLQCLQALRSPSLKRRPAPSALGYPLVAASSLFAQCLGPRVAVQPHSSHRPAPSYNTRRYYTSTGFWAAIICTNP